VIELKPGEMSLHHVRIIHGSPPNSSQTRRIGLAIRYLPTYVRQLGGHDSATLVRGEDSYRSFELEPRPQRDLEPAFVEIHQAITDRAAKLLLNGSRIKEFK
jgi:hypothetical protein